MTKTEANKLQGLISRVISRERALWALHTDNRNGFSISTDALTGCQYLNLPLRAAIPRVAADGKSHQGCRGVK